MWTTIRYGEADLINYVLIFTNIAFVFALLHQGYIFYKLYKEAIGRANNYYSENIEVAIGWMSNAAKLVMSLGVIGCFAAFAVPNSLAMGFFFMMYCFAIYIYVFKRFHHFMFTFDHGLNTELNIEENLEDIDDTLDEVGLIPSKVEEIENPRYFNTETYELLKKHIDEWINADGYTQKGVTIVVMASKVYSNRTYLSTYINTVYDCSFKVWITRLRMQKAKELLLERNHLSISEVADRVGCSSANSFNHLFKQSEGVSPAKWRSLQKGVSYDANDDKTLSEEEEDVGGI